MNKLKIASWLFAAGLMLFSCGEENKSTEEENPPVKNEEGRLSYEKREGGGVSFFRDPQGKLFAAWSEKDDNTQAFTTWFASYDEDKNEFGRPVEIPVSRGAVVMGEVKPVIAVKKDGTWVLVYTRFTGVGENDPRTIAFASLSTDAGKTWTGETVLHPDSANGTTHEFTQVATLPDGEVMVVWIYESGGIKKPGSCVMTCKTLPGGGFDKPVTLNCRSCECCSPGITVSDSGQVVISFREMQDGDQRNTQLLRSTDGGLTFREGGTLSGEQWEIDGCPVAGAALSANSHSFIQTVVHSEGMKGHPQGEKGLFFVQSMAQPGGTLMQMSPVRLSPTGVHPVLVNIPSGPEEEFGRSWLVFEEKGGEKNSGIVAVQVHGGLSKESPPLLGKPLSGEGTQGTYPAAILLKGNRLLVAWRARVGDNWPGIYWSIVNPDTM